MVHKRPDPDGVNKLVLHPRIQSIYAINPWHHAIPITCSLWNLVQAPNHLTVVSAFDGPLQKQVGCFNHRIFILVADKLKKENFTLVLKGHCIRQPKGQLPVHVTTTVH